MAAIANVQLTNTFDEWRTRTNQSFVKVDEVDGRSISAFVRANNNNGAIATANATITSAFSKANTAFEHGNTAYARANTAFEHGNSAYAKANTAQDTAVGSFVRANDNLGAIATANTNIQTNGNAVTAAFLKANNNTGAITTANNNIANSTGAIATANATITSSFLKANQAIGAVTTANGNITSSFSLANVAHNHANAAFSKANSLTGGSTVSTETTNTQFRVVWTSNTSGTMTYVYTEAGFYYNPHNNAISVGRIGVNNGSDTNATRYPVVPLYVSGDVAATGDITSAYSDRRLKEDIQNIESALDKLLSLSGVTYSPTDEAVKLSASPTKQRKAGVFAQDVQKVLPEAVSIAPFDLRSDMKSISGNEYLTVKYEQLIPLIIEAIKELNRKIDGK